MLLKTTSGGDILLSPTEPIHLSNIKKVILVSSGKGGVGKSTVSADLAVRLSKKGKKVGLLDADIHGPSINELFPVNSKPLIKNRKIQPILSCGVKLISIGFAISKEKPLAWKGYILYGVIRQLLEFTDWGTLDYLIIDQPPGTGDIHLALIQLLAERSAIVITTGSPLSVSQVRRTLSMYNEAKLPVIGLVENMSAIVCPKCDTQIRLFPQDIVKNLAKEFKIPLISSIPWVLKTESYAGSCHDDAYLKAFDLIVARLENS